MDKYLNTYNNTQEKLRAYHYAMWVLSWDQETETPRNAFDYRTQQIEILTNEIYAIESEPKYLESIEKLYENIETLDDVLAVEIKHAYKDLRIIKLVPKKEYIDYQVLQSQSAQIWAEAKDKDDFSIFEETLEKIVKYNKKLTKYLETPALKGYDVLLDLYEEGYTVKEYDLFFDLLKKELVPFVMSATAQRLTVTRKLTKGFFPVDKQAKFSDYLLDVMHFDRTRGVLKESVHPFTSNVSSTDVRITTAYKEDAIESSIFSTIHELGHAIYEQQVDSKLLSTNLGGGTSLGIHESQSRMFENMIGRSYAFWEVHYDKLKEIFAKELKGISLLEFYKHINVAKRSLIRTEADELTYSLHIMVRYEIEKQLINGTLKVKSLPKKWRQLMQSYVGVRPKSDADGVLQDIHWADGLIGYFPTYALGSAYAAQIYYAMNKDFNVENAISDNRIDKINLWLKEHIHQFGMTKSPKEIMMIATKEPFDPKYYVEYLKRKFAY